MEEHRVFQNYYLKKQVYKKRNRLYEVRPGHGFISGMRCSNESSSGNNLLFTTATYDNFRKSCESFTFRLKKSAPSSRLFEAMVPIIIPSGNTPLYPEVIMVSPSIGS